MENMKPAKDNKSMQKAIDAEIRGTTMDDFDRFEYFSMQNGRKIIYLSIIIFVAISAYFIIQSTIGSKENKIAGAFATAKTSEELSKALSEYGSSNLSSEARVRYAQLLLKDKKYDEVLAQYDYLLSSNAPDELKNRIKLDRGYVFELSGKATEAADIFAAISSETALPKYTIAEAAYAAGRICVQNNQLERGIAFLEQAKTMLTDPMQQLTYSDVAADFYARQAAFMLNLLNKNN